MGQPAQWAREFAAAAAEGQRLDIPDEAALLFGPAQARSAYRTGASSARERIWIQCDAAGEPAAAALVAWVALESLGSARPSPYRHLVTGRADVVVCGPAAAPLARPAAEAEVPLLDGGALGAGPGLLDVMDGFAPTLVVHVQDWSAWQRPPGADGTGGAAGQAAAPLQARLTESFNLDPALHRQLADAPRRRLGRPTAVAKALASHPEARPGQVGARALTVAGAALGPAAGEASGGLRLASGRYAPRLEWRRLGAASLCEISLATQGAAGLCLQLTGGPAISRATAALECVEAVILDYLGLRKTETAS